MDELLNSYLGGNMKDDEFSQRVNSFSDDEKREFEQKLADPEISQQIAKKSREELDRVTALRKEKSRLEGGKSGDDEQSNQSSEKTEDYATRLRKENVDTAFSQFFAKRGIAPEEQSLYRELFAQNDNGAVSVDNIVRSLDGLYASQNADELLALQQQHADGEAGAAEFNSQNAGSAGGSSDPTLDDNNRKFSPQVMEWVAESAKNGIVITPEQAERVLERGMRRKF